jgi:hypothetical protein
MCFLLKYLNFLIKILANVNKVCTFVMLVNYYYIFGLKKALATALFLQKTLRLIHNQHKLNNLNQEAPVLLELFFF